MTLLNIIKIFRTATENNPFLKSFNVHELYTLNQAPNVKYPSLFLEIPRVNSINKTTQNYKINFVIQDRTLEDKSNEIALLSKTKQIGETILQYIYNNYKDIYKTLEYNIVPYLDALTDRTVGWRFEIELIIQDNLLCKDVYEPIPLLQIPISLKLNTNIVVDISESSYSFVVSEPPIGLTIQWSIDNFYTIAGTGENFNITLNNPGTYTVYVRTTNGVDFSPVTTHSITFENFLPSPIAVTSTDKTNIEWELNNQNIILNVNKIIPTGLTVEWSDASDFSNILGTGDTLAYTYNSSTTPTQTLYVRTNNGISTSTINSVLISRKPFLLNTAWGFDKINDTVSIARNSLTNFETENFSVSFWYKVTNNSTTNGIITTYLLNVGITYTQFTNGSGVFALRNDSGGGITQYNIGTKNLPINTLINFIYVRNGTNRANHRIFINGVNQNTTTGISTPVNITPMGNILLGIDGSNNRLGGTIQHLMFFNRALTDAESIEIYNSGLGNYPPVSTIPNLVVYHTLQDYIGVLTQPMSLDKVSKNNGLGVGAGYVANPII